MNTQTPNRLRLLAVTLLVVVALGGCASAPTLVPPSGAPGALPTELTVYLEPGTSGVTVRANSLKSEFGCTVEYEIYEPTHSAEDGQVVATVILGHGFMSDLTRMRGWAEHWASHGVRTVVVSFCNSSWLSGRHDRNAADMIAVADAVVDSQRPQNAVIYAGFSAGGLSALLAADSDPRAISYLGLDPVDSGDMAAETQDLGMPSLFIFGEPSSCNAQSNMEPLVPPAGVAVRVPFASHCDFQNPYDPDCEPICGSVTPADTAAEIRDTILVLATAWIVDHGLYGGAGTVSVGTGLIDELESAQRMARTE